MVIIDFSPKNRIAHCFKHRSKYMTLIASVYLAEIYTYSQFVRGMHT